MSSDDRVAFHVPCGIEMQVLPGGFYLRCVKCDTPPLPRSASNEVELRRVEDGKTPLVSARTPLPLGVSHPACDVWPR